MSSSKHKDDPSFGDPYELLGLEFGASRDEDVARAYRRSALRYHPDKRKAAKTGESEEAMDAKFLELTEARNFLLDAEFREQRAAYDKRRRAEVVRREEKERRDASMGARRKRMRDDLLRKERSAARRRDGGALYDDEDEEEDETATKDRLRRENRRRAEDLTERRRRRRRADDDVENERDQRRRRQVRVRWSRRRVSESHSEDTLARLFGERFGEVEGVELVGAKGNAALVTFRRASDRVPCVEAYRHDETMRATYVVPPEEERVESTAPPSLRRPRDDLSPRERERRRAAEREELLRKMETEERGGVYVAPVADTSSKGKVDAARFYPPPFPIDDDEDVDDNGETILTLTPLQRLEKFEKALFSESLRSKFSKNAQPSDQ